MQSSGRLPAMPGPGPAAAPALVSVTGTGWPPVAPSVAAAHAAGRGPAVGLQHDGRAGDWAGDRSGAWLRYAAAGLTALAGAAAAVSFSAQYQMAESARHLPVIAGLEAAIPDASALVFACLGIALALHGRQAVRARFLNIAAVATSVFMNAIAAGPGWRAAAIWILPPVAYALASDTLIGVVRARAAARHGHRGSPAGEEATPLAVLGGAARWLLRLAVAPASTLAGFRAWVIAECPVAPGARASGTAPALGPWAGSPATAVAGTSSVPPARRNGSRTAAGPGESRPGTKTARFLALAEREHGPLAGIPLARVGRISAALSPRAGLNPGAGRTALRGAILAAQAAGPARAGMPQQGSAR